MAFEADHVLDRRALRRKVTFWRGLSFVAALLALIGMAWAMMGPKAFMAGLRPHVARIEISGLITGTAEQLALIRRVAASPMVQGVLVSIDSPGGTVSGSDALYEALRELAAKKPLVASINGTAASGGYIAALAADHIVARGTSITGSIGVVSQVPNAAQLLKNWGLEVETSRSAPLKMMPSGVEPTTAAGKAAMQALVDDHFAWFKGLVKERRQMSDEQLAAVSDGRAFTGRQALPLKLVDALGDEKAARAYLASRNVAESLPIETWRPRPVDGEQSFWRRLTTGALALVGLPATSVALQNAERMAATLLLEGPLVLWQPANP